MSYLTQRLNRRLQTLTASFRKQGLKGIAQRVVAHMRWLRTYRQRDAEFDAALNVDTKGPVELWHLRIRSRNVRHAIRYEGVNPIVLRQALGAIREHFEGYTFVDLGCGKGRALLIAHELGFSQMVGIEFAPRLAAVAQSNCNCLGVKAMVLSQDAAQYQFAAGKIVAYLYNPFGPSVLNVVLDNLLNAPLTESYVVYVNPVHRHCFENRPRMHLLTREPDYAIWKVVADRPESSMNVN